MTDEDEPRPKHCLACGEPLQGIYCHACGQGHRHPRLRLRAMFEDAIEAFVELDSRIFRTVWGLTVRPGKVVREYLDGRRVVYIHPFKYALVTVTLAFVVIPWVARTQSNSGVLPPWARLLNFGALPLLALLMQLVFYRRRLRWIEHYVLVLFALGHTFLLQAIVTSALMIAAPQALALSGIVPFVWLAWTARDALPTRWLYALPGAIVAFILMQYLVLGALWLVDPTLLPSIGD